MNEDDITFVVLDRSKLFLTEAFASFVAQLVEAGIVVKFSTVGPVGHFPSSCVINPHIEQVVKDRDLAGTLRIFAEAIDSINTHHVWEADGLIPRSTIPVSSRNAET